MTPSPASHPAPTVGHTARIAAWLTAALAFTLALALVSCGDSGGPSRSTTGAEPLRVGVSPVPHAEILRFVDRTLAAEAGLELEVVEYPDYVLPNVDLAKGTLDANYFQTPAFLTKAAAKLGTPLVSVAGVHIEPLGLYSHTTKTASAIPLGASVAVPKDDVTVTRALRLLAERGLIGVKDPQAPSIALADVVKNPKRLDFDAVEASRTPRALDDHDLAFINGNYALEAGLSATSDAVLVEPAGDNPAVNLLVVRAEDRDDPRVRTLARLLRSPAVKTFIKDRYRGAIVPAF